MSPLVLSSSSSSAGAGCHGTGVAEASSVCFSSDCPAPRSSGKSAPGRSPAAASSPVLAWLSMVLGPDFSPRWFSLVDSRQEGSPLTGGRHPGASPPGVMETVGVAPERTQHIASGLPTEVVETILQSSAPLTRKLYALNGAGRGHGNATAHICLLSMLLGFKRNNATVYLFRGFHLF